MAEAKCGFDDYPGGASGSDLLAAYGPTLFVDIGFDKNWKYATPFVIPQAGISRVDALIDTGAAECCIDDMLAVQLNLPIIDIRPISGSGGRHIANVYLAQIYVPSLNFVMYGAFAGVHLAEGGQTFKALIGRTFLKFFEMLYYGKTGTVIVRSP